MRLQVDDTVKPLALLSIYSSPHLPTLQEYSNCLWTCQSKGDLGLAVVDIKCIQSVVAMVPHSIDLDGVVERRFFLYEKIGLDVAHIAGQDEELTEV
jgi:hypothetical protein